MRPRRNRWNRDTTGLTENIKLRPPLMRAPRRRGKVFHYVSNSITGNSDIPNGAEVTMIQLPQNSRDIFCTVRWQGVNYRVSWKDLCD